MRKIILNHSSNSTNLMVSTHNSYIFFAENYNAFLIKSFSDPACSFIWRRFCCATESDHALDGVSCVSRQVNLNYYLFVFYEFYDASNPFQTQFPKEKNYNVFSIKRKVVFLTRNTPLIFTDLFTYMLPVLLPSP